VAIVFWWFFNNLWLYDDWMVKDGLSHMYSGGIGSPTSWLLKKASSSLFTLWSQGSSWSQKRTSHNVKAFHMHLLALHLPVLHWANSSHVKGNKEKETLPLGWRNSKVILQKGMQARLEWFYCVHLWKYSATLSNDHNGQFSFRLINWYQFTPNGVQ
jgi:hypothetical protein